MRIGVDARNLITSMSGIGRYVLEMCRHLVDRGHELYLYLPEEPKEAIPTIRGLNVRIAQFPGGPRRMIWAHSILPYQAYADRVDVFWGPAHRLPFQLDRRIARVVTIHDLVWREMATTMRLQTWLGDRFLMAPAVARADRIVAVSQATAAALASIWPMSREKTRTIYPGLTALTDSKGDLSRFGIDRPFALFVGTLEPRKNLKRLLEAYSKLPTSVRDECLLVLAGGQGWHLNDLNAHIGSLNLSEHVLQTGYVPDTELRGLYARAKFLVMPSLYEGFGFPIIEANAEGVPVLTSNTASMPEVSGDAALLVDPFSVDSIAYGFGTMATEPERLAILASKAKANAARFSWRTSASELEAVFTSAQAERSLRFPP